MKDGKKMYLVMQKNANGEYVDVGIMTMSEATRLEFETKRAVVLVSLGK